MHSLRFKIARFPNGKLNWEHLGDGEPTFITKDNLDLIELCAFLDDDANQRNFGHFDIHEDLAEIIARAAGEDKAKEIMLTIAERGGLHEFSDF
jgi:hypothetical protein